MFIKILQEQFYVMRCLSYHDGEEEEPSFSVRHSFYQESFHLQQPKFQSFESFFMLEIEKAYFRSKHIAKRKTLK